MLYRQGVWLVLRPSRHRRTVPLIFFRASLLIAGTNPVNVTLSRSFRTPRGRNVYPKNVNAVCSYVARRFASLQCRVARGNLTLGLPQNGA